MINDATIPEVTKVALALDIWFGERPDVDLGATIAAMLEFYRCGKTQAADEEESSGQIYSYEHDWDAVFSGFLSTYRIDLLDPTTTLHWWKFRSMLMALPEDSQFMRIVGYRCAKVSSDMSKEQRAHILKMKRIYALPDPARPVRVRSDTEYREVLAAIIAAKLEAKRDV